MNLLVQGIKKRGLLNLLLVPLLKALALPNPPRTSNAEAHADMLIQPIARIFYIKIHYWLSIKTYL